MLRRRTRRITSTRVMVALPVMMVALMAMARGAECA